MGDTWRSAVKGCVSHDEVMDKFAWTSGITPDASNCK